MTEGNAGNGKIPILVDHVPSNEPRSLKCLCIKFIVFHEEVIFHVDKTASKRLHDLKIRDNVFIPPILSDELFNCFLLSSSISIEKIFHAFSDANKCCLQTCKLSNAKVNVDALFKLCFSQNIQVLELFNVKFSNASSGAVKRLPLLCTTKMTSFQLDNISPTPKKFLFQCFSKVTHPFLKMMKLSGNSCPWHFLVDENSSFPLVTLDLSNMTSIKEPPAVSRDMQHYFQAAKQSEKSLKKKLKSGDEALQNSQTTTGGNANQESFRLQDSSFPPLLGWQAEPDPGSPFKIPRGSDELNLYLATKEADACETDTEVSEEPLNLSTTNIFKPLRHRLESFKETLLSLTLFDTLIGEDDVETIFQLKKLQHLDIGASPQRTGRVLMDFHLTVWEVLERLPELNSLDVSSTDVGEDLYSTGEVKKFTGERKLGRCVPRKLDFLGLCETSGCEIIDIYSLARQVSGHHLEEQIMTALQRYQKRPKLLSSAYKYMFDLQRNQSTSCPYKLLKILLGSLYNYPDDDELALLVTANLFFVARQNWNNFTLKQRNEIALALIKCIDRHLSYVLVIRNALLTLHHLLLPQKCITDIQLIMKTLLTTLAIHQNNTNVNSLAINLCNALICRMTNDLRKEVSKYNFMPIFLDVIRNRMRQNVCDEVLLVAWSALWNVSDETAINSEDFIRLDGLEVLQECFKQFAGEMELQKNMMGLVGNIAEVRKLRTFLMNPKLMNIFCELLNEVDQHLEVAYNVCGSLSHLLSDGEDAWTCDKLPRNAVRRDLYRVVESWDDDATRCINYRSFLPILGLIDCDVPESIHWAVWALSNLSGFNNKYYQLLLDENGVEMLKKIEHKDVADKTKELARNLVLRIERYEKPAEAME